MFPSFFVLSCQTSKLLHIKNSKNLYHWQKSLLEVIRKNIDVWCQNTFENKKVLFSKVCWQHVLPLHLNQTFQPIIWISNEGEDDGIESRLRFKIFSTLNQVTYQETFGFNSDTKGKWHTMTRRAKAWVHHHTRSWLS